MLHPRIHTDGPLSGQHAVLTLDPEETVAATEFEQELILRMRVRNERTANEIYRGPPKGALKNPDWLVYLVRRCRDAQLISSRNSGKWIAAVLSYSKKPDSSVSRQTLWQVRKPMI
jgi:hypothetical protein